MNQQQQLRDKTCRLAALLRWRSLQHWPPATANLLAERGPQPDPGLGQNVPGRCHFVTISDVLVFGWCLCVLIHIVDDTFHVPCFDVTT